MIELTALVPERIPTPEAIEMVYEFRTAGRPDPFANLIATSQEIVQTFPMIPQHAPKSDSEESGTLSAKDPYLAIHAPDEYQKAVADMITTLANTSLPGLAFKKSYLNRKGEEISSHNIHTLKFLECILTKPELKECLRRVRSSSMKWNGLLWGEGGREKGDGTGGALDKLAAENKLNAYLPGFVHVLNKHGLKVNLNTLRTFSDKRDWQGMLDYLMEYENK
ncbi:MAG: hypothetical protein ACHQT8_05435 [Chlamydiales bacterium]